MSIIIAVLVIYFYLDLIVLMCWILGLIGFPVLPEDQPRRMNMKIMMLLFSPFVILIEWLGE
jgi:energy-converting hydrogenase Eha subunit A